eukprot:1944069-Lingulodinium_polyedra.AAC.1
MSGATELQCSAFLPFDTVRHARTAASGRVGSREHSLMFVLSDTKMLEYGEVFKNEAGHLVSLQCVPEGFIELVMER